MFISTSNDVTEDNLNVTSGASTVPVSYMVNRDFSEVYRSSTTTVNLTIELNLWSFDVGYISLAGLDFKGKVSEVAFEYWNGATWIGLKSYPITSDSTIMHIVGDSPPASTKYRVIVTKIFSNDVIGIAHIAAGSVWEVSNHGEESGFKRLWTTPQFKQRTQTNQGAPAVSVIENTDISGSLKLSNISTQDVVDVWVDFQQFAVKNGFFMVEDENFGERGYYCYSCQPSPVSAHSQTRSLQVANIKYNAWTGRTA